MLNWLKSVITDALRLRRQADLDTRADHAARMSREISAEAEALRLAMLAKVNQPAEPKVRGLSYPQAKF